MTTANTSRYVSIPGTWGTGWTGLTIVGWAYVIVNPASSFQALASSPSIGEFGHCQVYSAVDPAAVMSSYGPGVGANTSPAPIAPTATWQHYAMAHVSGDGRTYVDGAQFGATGTGLWGGTLAPTSALTLALGFGPGRFLSGRLAKVAIFDRQLSAARIAAYAGAASAAAYSAAVLADGPYAYWKLDETSGTVAADSSGNARHGTYVGSPVLGRSGPLSDLAAQFVDDDSVGWVIGSVVA